MDRRTTVLIFVQISHGKLKRYYPRDPILILDLDLVLVSGFKAGTGAMGNTDTSTKYHASSMR